MSAPITALPTAPAGDAFYYPPSSLLEGEHGEVIWSRPLEGAAALTGARSNEVVLYRSRDVHGNPIAVSGIIALPPADPPPGGYPVISWAHGTIGSADHCAPSRDTPESPSPPRCSPRGRMPCTTMSSPGRAQGWPKTAPSAASREATC
ncbi:hypothetical protein [Sorangium sp. So ce1151]|uniref:hypothetical protein n=1 Tax=Sorangium sp. So ce1151 TaxID=3133332 RepID=UPI003F62FDEF